MILHIHTSNTIFANLASEIFHDLEIEGLHLLLGEGSNISDPPSNSHYIKPGSIQYYDFIKTELAKYNLILFHGLLGQNLIFLKDIAKHLPSHPPIGWVIYGSEIEESFIFPSGMLGPFTKKIYYSLLPYRVLVPGYRLSLRLLGRNLRNQLTHVSYYAHFMQEELDFVKHHTGIERPMLYHSYTRIDHFIEPELRQLRCIPDGGILIGNSASFTSNHMEIFACLKQLGTQKKQIVVPLSYGNKHYRRYIVKKGGQIFGKHFTPITSLLPKEEYHRRMLNCSTLILNHHKQQALGNLVAALWFGMRVYLHRFTSTFIHFKQLGIVLFSIEDDLNQQNINLYTGLSDQETEHNRQILEEVFSKTALNAAMKRDFFPFA